MQSWLRRGNIQYNLNRSSRQGKEFAMFGLPGRGGGGGWIAGAGAGTGLVDGAPFGAGGSEPGPGVRVAGPEAGFGGKTAGALDPTHGQP